MGKIDELKNSARTIKTNELPQSNTALLIGSHLEGVNEVLQQHENDLKDVISEQEVKELIDKSEEERQQIFEQNEAQRQEIPNKVAELELKVGGDLSQLTTTDKSSLINAINEAAKSGGSLSDEQIGNIIKNYLKDHPIEGGVQIVDNLTSTSNSSALSAKQGKMLKDLIDNISLVYEDEIIGEKIAINFVNQNCSISNFTNGVVYGSPYVTKIYPMEGYNMSRISVFMGGVNVNQYISDDTISIPSVTSDVRIECIAVAKTFSVNTNFTNCVLVGNTYATYGEQYSATISAEEGYTVNHQSVNVMMNGENVNRYYTNGVLNIPSVTGEITITCEAIVDTNENYNVYYNLTNCTSSNTMAKVQRGTSFNTVINPAESYYISSITATMNGSNIPIENGNIVISNVTGDIVITAECKRDYTNSTYIKQAYFTWLSGQNKAGAYNNPNGAAYNKYVRITAGGHEDMWLLTDRVEYNLPIGTYRIVLTNDAYKRYTQINLAITEPMVVKQNELIAEFSKLADWQVYAPVQNAEFVESDYQRASVSYCHDTNEDMSPSQAIAYGLSCKEY